MLTFKEWIALVDKEVHEISGVSYRDLADIDYYGFYTSEMSPRETAEEALENDGFPLDDYFNYEDAPVYSDDDLPDLPAEWQEDYDETLRDFLRGTR